MALENPETSYNLYIYSFLLERETLEINDLFRCNLSGFVVGLKGWECVKTTDCQLGKPPLPTTPGTYE